MLRTTSPAARWRRTAWLNGLGRTIAGAGPCQWPGPAPSTNQPDVCHDLSVNLQRQLAEIHARQVNRASVAANIVLIGGVLATLALLFGMNSWVGLATVGFAAAVTAALYAATSALSARAQAAVALHLDAALAEETATPAAITSEPATA